MVEASRPPAQAGMKSVDLVFNSRGSRKLEPEHLYLLRGCELALEHRPEGEQQVAGAGPGGTDNDARPCLRLAVYDSHGAFLIAVEQPVGAPVLVQDSALGATCWDSGQGWALVFRPPKLAAGFQGICSLWGLLEKAAAMGFPPSPSEGPSTPAAAAASNPGSLATAAQQASSGAEQQQQLAAPQHDPAAGAAAAAATAGAAGGAASGPAQQQASQQQQQWPPAPPGLPPRPAALQQLQQLQQQPQVDAANVLSLLLGLPLPPAPPQSQPHLQAQQQQQFQLPAWAQAAAAAGQPALLQADLLPI